MRRKGTRPIDRIFLLKEELGTQQKVADRLGMSRQWVSDVLNGKVAWTKELDGAGRATLKNAQKFDSKKLRKLNDNVRRIKNRAKKNLQEDFELGDIASSGLLDQKFNPFEGRQGIEDNPRLEAAIQSGQKSFSMILQVNLKDAEQFETIEFPITATTNKQFISGAAAGGRFGLDSFPDEPYKSIEVIGILRR